MEEGWAGQGGSRPGGAGEVVVELVGGRSVATRFASSYPLKLMHPARLGIWEAPPPPAPPETDQGQEEDKAEDEAEGAPAAGAAAAAGTGAARGGALSRGGSGAAVVYVVTYGGGILGGDCISLRCRVEAGAAAVLTTQSSTKVFKCLPPPSPPTRQVLSASVGAGALLLLAPDPVTCFAGARLRQQQSVAVAQGGSLALVEWLTSGRKARGEEWDLDCYESSSRIFWGGTLLAAEQVRLEASGGLVGLPLREQLQGLHCLGFMALLGPHTREAQDLLTAAVQRMGQRQLGAARAAPVRWAPAQAASPAAAPLAGTADSSPGPSAAPGAEHGRREATGPGVGDDEAWEREIWVSCSPMDLPPDHEKGLIVRFAARSTEPVYRFLRRQLAPLGPAQGGWTPYAYLGGS